jgi:acyl-CoA hydrolase
LKGLKQEYALSQLLINFSLKCAIKRAQKSEVGLKMNGTNFLLPVPMTLMLSEKAYIQKNTKALLVASMEVGLEVNPENTKHMLMSRYQKAGPKHNIMIASRSF